MHTRSLHLPSGYARRGRPASNATQRGGGAADVIRRTDPRLIFKRAPLQLQLPPTIQVRRGEDPASLRWHQHGSATLTQNQQAIDLHGNLLLMPRREGHHLKLDGPAIWKVCLYIEAVVGCYCIQSNATLLPY